MTVKPVSFDTVASTSTTTLLKEHVPAYRAYLVERGHAVSYVDPCAAVMARLDLWMTQACKCLGDLNENLVEEFLCQRVPPRRAAVPGRRPDDHHAPLVHLLVVLRTARAVPPKALDATPVGEELRRFDYYLSHARGCAVPEDADCVFVVNLHSGERSAVPAGRVQLLRISRALAV